MKSDHSVTSAAPTPTQDIYADGDVIFVVGEEQRGFRVSSAVMKGASKVFHTMLSPGFSEGETLVKSGQVTVPLPEDNADGMFAILCILHGRNELVPPQLVPEEIYHVAVLSDKYDLATPLMFAAEHWLDLPAVSDDTRGLWLLMCSAYLLECERSFSEITRKLVIHHAGSYRILEAGKELDSGVVRRICTFLEENRNKVRGRLLSALYQPWVLQDSCPCGWNARYLQTILFNGYDMALRPDFIHVHSIAHACTLAKKTRCPSPRYSWDKCSKKLGHDSGADFMASIGRAVDDSLVFKGLCRSCAQTGEPHEVHQHADE